MHPFLQARLASQYQLGGHRKLLKGVICPHRMARAIVPPQPRQRRLARLSAAKSAQRSASVVSQTAR